MASSLTSISKRASAESSQRAMLRAGRIRTRARTSASSTGSWPSVRVKWRRGTCSAGANRSMPYRSSGAGITTSPSSTSDMRSGGTPPISTAHSTRATARSRIPALGGVWRLPRCRAIARALLPKPSSSEDGARCDGYRDARSLLHARWDVVGPLAGAKLGDADVGEAACVERVLVDNGLNLLFVPADSEDDAAITRNLPARHQEVAGGVILLQEPDVRAHVRVDLRQVNLVDQFDHEHIS